MCAKFFNEPLLASRRSRGGRGGLGGWRGLGGKLATAPAVATLDTAVGSSVCNRLDASLNASEDIYK